MIGWLKTRAWPLIEGTITEWNEDGGSTIAAATAYYAAFSFFPLILLLSSLLGYLLRFSIGAQDYKQRLIEVIAENSSYNLANSVQSLLMIVENNAGVSGPVAAAGLLFGALGVFAQLDNAFDHIWDIPAPESAGIIDSAQRILHGRFKAFLMMLALGLLMVLAFITSMVMTTIERFTTYLPYANIGWRVIQTGVGVIVYTLLFGLIYTILPRRSISWRDALPGALLAAIIWEIGRLLLAVFVVGNRYSSAYGVVGSFIALMVWIYYASMVLFLGAEYVQVHCRLREKWQEQEQPQSKQEQEPPRVTTSAVEAPIQAPPANRSRAAYAAGGALLGALGAVLLFPIALLVALRRRLRRR